MSKYFNPVEWKQRQTQYPNRRILTDATTQVQQTVYVERDEGTTTEAGTPFTGTTMNGLEDRIDDAFEAIEAFLYKDLTGTLTAGDTTVTISDASIVSTSTLEFYTDTFGVNPKEVSVSTGSVTLTFDAQQSNLGVKVRVFNELV